MTRLSWRHVPIVATLAFSFVLSTGLIAGQADAKSTLDPANAHFQQRWERTDKPVAELRTSRTWMWGPGAFTDAIPEPYAESPGGHRQVQYFDKARMEITQPDAHAPNLWYVTTGRLAWELATGRAQFGDNTFKNWLPADINVAGDLDDPDAPTYATIGALMASPALDVGSVITQRLDSDNTVVQDPKFASLGVTADHYVSTTEHVVAEPFWDFLNSDGLVYQDGTFMQDDLFLDPFYASGLPITEAYWITVRVDGEPTDVLIQAFERRVLTYTPSNPDGWKVESGNTGRHYYQWYYGPHSQADGGQ